MTENDNMKNQSKVLPWKEKHNNHDENESPRSVQEKGEKGTFSDL